jgi:hypothetical protein
MDLRGIPLNYNGPGNTFAFVLEVTEPGMTVDNTYEIFGLVVDCAPSPPKPYALTADDSKHFHLLELSKARLV